MQSGRYGSREYSHTQLNTGPFEQERESPHETGGAPKEQTPRNLSGTHYRFARGHSGKQAHPRLTQGESRAAR